MKSGSRDCSHSASAEERRRRVKSVALGAEIDEVEPLATALSAFGGIGKAISGLLIN